MLKVRFGKHDKFAEKAIIKIGFMNLAVPFSSSVKVQVNRYPFNFMIKFKTTLLRVSPYVTRRSSLLRFFPLTNKKVIMGKKKAKEIHETHTT